MQTLTFQDSPCYCLIMRLAPIIDLNNETLQEHLDEINISHNDLQTVELLDSQKIIMMQY